MARQNSSNSVQEVTEQDIVQTVSEVRSKASRSGPWRGWILGQAGWWSGYPTGLDWFGLNPGLQRHGKPPAYKESEPPIWGNLRWTQSAKKQDT